ncbi:MAG: LytTR family DNA-binding domain-containing protein [Chitinophagaceae bacterium]
MALSYIRVVIVEDQPTIRKDVQLLMEQQHGFIVVGTCGSVREARAIIPATLPDLLLLDVTLDDGTGFDILQEQSATAFKVIFLTAHPDHAIQAIKVGALDYLLKPVDRVELEQALAKVLKGLPTQLEQISVAQQYLLSNNKGRHIVLRAADYLQKVELDKIIYCSSDGGYTTFFLADGKKVVTSRYLKEYEDILSAASFIRPHQSYMVNFQFIDRYHKEGHLVLKDGTKIPVATRKKEAVLELFNKL